MQTRVGYVAELPCGMVGMTKAGNGFCWNGDEDTAQEHLSEKSCPLSRTLTPVKPPPKEKKEVIQREHGPPAQLPGLLHKQACAEKQRVN